jgi:hypothetical protein
MSPRESISKPVPVAVSDLEGKGKPFEIVWIPLAVMSTTLGAEAE